MFKGMKLLAQPQELCVITSYQEFGRCRTGVQCTQGGSAQYTLGRRHQKSKTVDHHKGHDLSRMHSSKMCAIRCSGWGGNSVCLGGCLPKGVSAQGGICLGDVWLGGVCQIPPS